MALHWRIDANIAGYVRGVAVITQPLTYPFTGFTGCVSVVRILSVDAWRSRLHYLFGLLYRSAAAISVHWNGLSGAPQCMLLSATG